MISMEDRIMRILDTTHVVRLDGMSVHRIEDVAHLTDDIIYVECADGMFFQDIDVFTLEEAANMEKRLDEVKATLLS
tara:strand:+ start:5599 stop:5829 length:231 start_codon:yes stop_codon:yes gene_type:complete